MRALRSPLQASAPQDVDRSDDAVPSFVVPDESAWLLWGRDLRRSGFAAVASPLAACVLVGPSRVPPGLAEAVAEAWRLLPHDRRHLALDQPELVGRPLEDVLREDGEASTGEDDEDHAHGEHEHGSDAGHGGHNHHGGGGHGEQSAAGGNHQAGHRRVAVRPPPDVDVPAPPAPPPAPGGPERSDHDVQRSGDEQQNMMPIEGDPSTDGLVMESVDLELGPLGTVLPGGLVARVTLDGDVVAACWLEAALSTPRSNAIGPLTPDPLAAAAWREATSAVGVSTAEGPASAGGWASLVDVELERAASHLVWLRALGVLLGWADLVDAALGAVTPVLDARAARSGVSPEPAVGRRPSLSPGEVDGVLAESEGRMAPLRRLVADDRRLIRRMRGRAQIDLARVKSAGASGPVARAAGLREDERLSDSRYAGLGFDPVVDDDGDALARTRLRLDEAREALRLARAALERERHESGQGPGRRVEAVDGGCTATVEGPRGPVQVTLISSADELRFAAPGQEAARDLAARSVIGEEWSAALVALVSFDVSPWRVGD